MKSFAILGALVASSLVEALPLSIRSCEDTPDSASTSDNGTSSFIAASWIQGFKTNPTTLATLNFSKYTHMTYGFAETQENATFSLTDSNPDALPLFVNMTKQNNVKSILSLGGWYGSRFFSNLIATPENRTALANSILDLASTYSLDGIEFDWEYPNNVGACNAFTGADPTNLVALVQELRNSTTGQNLILTSTVSGALWNSTQASNDTNIVALADALDYISIMNYDVFGSFSSFAGPNAPLNDTCASQAQQDAGFSAVRAVQAWNDAGVPLDKLVLGIPTYGHSYAVSPENATSDNFATLNTHPNFDNTLHPLGSQDNGSNETFVDVCGVTNFASGAWDFAGLVDAGYLDATGAFNSEKTSAHWMFDECAQTPMLYDEDAQVWISYDDPQSFRAKGEFIKDMGLRGFASFEAYGDVQDAMLDAVRSGAGL
ncbi:glycoside hydrolase family 18 protein [Peniophora sp. CONT]|nr:glycoside hydrolase family 18 protein [Peniophora sp. CONT]